MQNQSSVSREELRDSIDLSFIRAGHKPEDRSCDHGIWKLELHGRHCPTCGTAMVDFGD